MKILQIEEGVAGEVIITTTQQFIEKEFFNSGGDWKRVAGLKGNVDIYEFSNPLFVLIPNEMR